MRNKFVCIHGHYYQPPRENPYTERIQKQDSAAPFHDWNDKINFECYGPNAFARVLNSSGQITKIINNYQYISFNFGPTLINWLKENAPQSYKGIIKADKMSMKLNGGHGASIAQVYNHIIMPYANRKDKEIQVKWGISDFKYHFGRFPEGMWLAETAVDSETLEVLAENDIKFTILSPYQAKAVKPIQHHDFELVNANTLNTNIPYRFFLPSGKSIIIFFYNGSMAHDLSFGNLLKSGDGLYERLKNSLNFKSHDNELSITALDGETFGHHHKQGEMALAYCIDRIIKEKEFRLVNLAYYLSFCDITHEVKIKERTAWSCAHGIDRWNKDCGCSIQHNNWNQKWREPLREALNYLNDEIDSIFHEKTSRFFDNPHRVLIDYINIILQRSKTNALNFFEERLNKKIDEETLTLLLRLFECKRNCQLMFSSCGWFFDDISGIESKQILFYADRVLQILDSICNTKMYENISNTFLGILAKAKSNIDSQENGELVYRKHVLPNRQALKNVGIKYSLYMLFDDIHPLMREKNFSTKCIHEPIKKKSGYQSIICCTIEVASEVTFSKRYFHFTVVQVGRANYLGYYIMNKDLKFLHEFKEISSSLSLNDIPKLIKTLNAAYPTSYNLNDLNIEDKEILLNQITEKEIKVVNANLQDIYLRNYPLNTEYINTNIVLPRYTKNIITFVLVEKFIAQLDDDNFNINEVIQTKNEMLYWNIKYDDQLSDLQNSLRYCFRKILTSFVKTTKENYLTTLEQLIIVISDLKLEINNWNNANAFVGYLTKEKEHVNMKIKNDNQFKKQIESVAQFLNIDIKFIIN